MSTAAADRTSLIGTTGPDYEVLVERGKVMEFARATGSTSPAYLADAAPVIPPTFLTTAGLTWAPPEANLLARADLDLRRVLHGEEEYVFYGPPPRAGTTLRARPRIADVTEKVGRRGGTMTLVTLVTEFADSDGAVVAEQRTTAIETAGGADA